MLSRVADNLYWMSRYLERAEHTARLIDVELNLRLEQSVRQDDPARSYLLGGLKISLALSSSRDTMGLVEALTFDPSNCDSIVACIAAARENARNVREQISSEMWEQLNRVYLAASGAGAREAWRSQLHEFFRVVKEGSQLFQGIADSTMNRGEGWNFIQLGRYIERTCDVAALLDAHFRRWSAPHDLPVESAGYLEWVGMLKSCTAFEAYCKVYSAALRPQWIAEFMLLNREFPHSVRFSVEAVHAALNRIAELSPARKAESAIRVAGKLRAALRFAQVEELLGGDLHEYLQDVERQCAHIHGAIQRVYIAYPVEEALVS
jgi:uncharacterized alpha-E superfamily protein